MISTGDLGKKSSELAVLQLNISVDTDSDYSSRPGGSVPQGNDNSDDHILAYVLIPLGALVLIAVLSFSGKFLHSFLLYRTSDHVCKVRMLC